MRWKPFLFLSALTVILTGCGGSENGSLVNGGSESGGNSAPPVVEASKPPRPELDWRTDSWNFGSLSVATHDLYLQDFMQDPASHLSGYEVISSSFSYQGDIYYRLDLLEKRYASEEAEEKKREFSLSCYDGGKMEMWNKALPVPELEEYDGLEVIYTKMDMVSGDELVLFFGVYDEEGEMTAYPAVHMDLNGNRLSVTDLLPAMREGGLEILPLYPYKMVCADRQGCYYLLPDYAIPKLEPGRIMVLDPEGNPAGFIGSEEDDAYVNIATDSDGGAVTMKDPDGNAVFKVYIGNRQELCLTGYRPGTGEKLYAQIQAEYGSTMSMSAEGYLYYTTGAGDLYRWDLYTGDREFCVNYLNLGLKDFFGLLLGVGESGQLTFLDCSLGINAKLYQLGTDPGKAKSEIRMVSLTRDNCRYVSECALGYSTEHPEYIISLEKPGIEGLRYYDAVQAVSDYRTRALVDLTAGKGADMYYVTAGDMQILYEKGVLADLSDVLPQEYVDAIYPGFLGCGVIDGKQAGMPAEGYVTIVMADNSLWPGESWSWDEAMVLKEANPQREQMMIMLMGNYGHSTARGYGTSENTIFRELYLRYLTETPFLDMEAGTCDFDSPQFIRLLEMINDNPSSYTWGTWEEPLPEQCAVAFMQDVTSFPGFTYMMKDYGEKYHLVGYPAEKDGGSYWSCDYYLVVNKDTAYMEQIREYLISLYDYERQRDKKGYTSLPIRSDLLMQDLLRVDTYSYPSRLMYGWTAWEEVAVKPDGTTWDQEYLELLNAARPYRNMDPALEDIIMEEVGAYFSGDRDVKSVAAQIQNRVQLYLDERK